MITRQSIRRPRWERQRKPAMNRGATQLSQFAPPPANPFAHGEIPKSKMLHGRRASGQDRVPKLRPVGSAPIRNVVPFKISQDDRRTCVSGEICPYSLV